MLRPAAVAVVEASSPRGRSATVDINEWSLRLCIRMDAYWSRYDSPARSSDLGEQLGQNRGSQFGIMHLNDHIRVFLGDFLALKLPCSRKVPVIQHLNNRPGGRYR